MLSQLIKLPTNAKVGVVGGGISGLTFTYFLGKLRPDVHITLFNPESRPGGWINSWDTQDKNRKPVMIERGPRTFRGVSDGTVMIMDSMLEMNKGDIIRTISKDSNADKKFIVDPTNKLIQVPNSLTTLIKFFLNPLSKGLLRGMITEWTRKPIDSQIKDESVLSLLTRRYGSVDIGRNLFSALYRGIYADDVGNLSARKVVGKLYYDERKYGSITKASIARWRESSNKSSEDNDKLSESVALYTKVFNKDENKIRALSKRLAQFPMLGLKGGLSQFPNTFKEAIIKLPNVSLLTDNVMSMNQSTKKDKMILEYMNINGKETHLKTTAKEFDHIRLAVAPNIFSKLIARTNPKIKEKLDLIKTNTVTLVNLYIPDKDIIPKEKNGFGYLIPETNSNPEKVLGVIFDSVIEKSFKPFGETSLNTTSSPPQNYTKLTAMVGGSMYNDAEGKQNIANEQQTILNVKSALQKHLGASKEDLDAGQWIYTVAKDCLPQFKIGYNNLIKSIEQDVINDYSSKVSLGGMGFSKSPGIPDVVTDALIDATKLQ
ncbi:similar to Saccharomyces cerevisiae YER014W HEM14 Protoporphyrinogen oxidase [Maudiozyma barnettii]|uniref:Protoporphyrinogen oxidase n=1 Tax=Maudiozyma barnettii TaxID=61262 RepID=A0A8H2VEJ3_9SACH|nr:oxygen-dependent protoporphyrinogen oxidase [Kazachstania barnettii]CAB4254061.1 similar to Saccharomyces cerevisiae YER014W HEM14 Protoporphyrinogen oxidase [Kazachstania barnettii]CAD1781811.1 similar to Saccharomyces cerevisiae YER014W HEM14 Protoporphyrinogen oxidase [Kazachstania barnettii]